jgi:parallel beta-helix repeat protein
MSSVRDFGAKGDGQTDDTDAFQHALEQGDGEISIPRGDYRLARTLIVPLDKFGRLAIRGVGGTARIVMAGSGPALHLIGTHKKTAHPPDFAEAVWQKERMPNISDLEIVGANEAADGIRLEGTMQGTLRGLLIRRCRHGIHLVNRNRNVIIADCHIYDNRGVGVFLDRVNLHQINIHGNHISYCQRGGIVVTESEVRNIQICSNDIEYNYDLKAEQSADIWFDARKGTVREGTIVGNTIQAKTSPGGANIRFTGAGKENPNAVGMISIGDNLIGSQETNLHLQACRGIVVSGNSIYNGTKYALLAEDCEHLFYSANSHDHNSDYKGESTDAFSFQNCRNVNIAGVIVQHTHPSTMPVHATMDFHGCRNLNITGCQIQAARTRGISISNSNAVRITDCIIRGREGDDDYQAPIVADIASDPIMIVNNLLSAGRAGNVLPNLKSVHATGNVWL